MKAAIIGMILIVIMGLTVIFTNSLQQKPVIASEIGELTLLGKSNPEPNMRVYVYEYKVGGLRYLFVVASRDFKDGVSVTQLK